LHLVGSVSSPYIITRIKSHYVNGTHSVNSGNIIAHRGHDEGFPPRKQL